MGVDRPPDWRAQAPERPAPPPRAGRAGDGGGDPPSGKFEAWAPVQTAGELLSKRWAAAILWMLTRSPRRFTHLVARLPITPKVLTEHLRELERDGLVARWSAGRGRKHVEYSLTASGESLRPVIEQLHAWGAAYLRARSAPGPAPASVSEPSAAAAERALRPVAPPGGTPPGSTRPGR